MRPLLLRKHTNFQRVKDLKGTAWLLSEEAFHLIQDVLLRWGYGGLLDA